MRGASTPADQIRETLVHYQVDHSRESLGRQNRGQELREVVLSGPGHDLVQM